MIDFRPLRGWHDGTNEWMPEYPRHIELEDFDFGFYELRVNADVFRRRTPDLDKLLLWERLQQ